MKRESGNSNSNESTTDCKSKCEATDCKGKPEAIQKLQSLTTFIMSFPRSGNSLCRTLIEFLSETETRGCITNPNDLPICRYIHHVTPTTESTTPTTDTSTTVKIYQKVHQPKELETITGKSLASVDDWSKDYRLILIVREPEDAIVSHLREHISCLHSHSHSHSQLNGPQIALVQDHVKQYLQCITTYLEWKGPKHTICYEHLTDRDHDRRCKTISDLANFIGGISEERLQQCFKNIDHLYASALTVLARPPKSHLEPDVYRRNYKLPAVSWKTNDGTPPKVRKFIAERYPRSVLV